MFFFLAKLYLPEAVNSNIQHDSVEKYKREPYSILFIYQELRLLGHVTSKVYLSAQPAVGYVTWGESFNIS